MIEPITKGAGATRRGAMKIVGTVISLPDIDHSTGNHAIADNADAPIIECLPLPKAVRSLEGSKLFVQGNVSVHRTRHDSVEQSREKGAIGGSSAPRLGNCPSGDVRLYTIARFWRPRGRSDAFHHEVA